jgi:hypothetical protein
MISDFPAEIRMDVSLVCQKHYWYSLSAHWCAVVCPLILAYFPYFEKNKEAYEITFLSVSPSLTSRSSGSRRDGC